MGISDDICAELVGIFMRTFCQQFFAQATGPFSIDLVYQNYANVKWILGKSWGARLPQTAENDWPRSYYIGSIPPAPDTRLLAEEISCQQVVLPGALSEVRPSSNSLQDSYAFSQHRGQLRTDLLECTHIQKCRSRKIWKNLEAIRQCRVAHGKFVLGVFIF